MSRRSVRILIAAALAAVLLLAACTSSDPAVTALPTPRSLSPPPSPTVHPGHVWWGLGGDNMPSVVPRLEQEIGRPFAIVRKYSLWDRRIPSAIARTAAVHGAIPYVSWELYRKRGRQLTFADVADGSQDAWIRQQAQSIRDSGIRMFFTFMHEPEIAQGQGRKPQLGSASEYVAAFDHVHRIFQQEHVTNVVWLLTLIDRTYLGVHGGPRAWLPPPADYSYLGVDGYLKWPCEKQLGERTFEQIFAPAEKLSKQLGKPLFIGEVGVQEFTACGNPTGTPQDKADWITAAAATAKTWPNLRAICWTYSSNYQVKDGVTLVWNEDSSPPALAAFRKAGLDPYFGRGGWPDS